MKAIIKSHLIDLFIALIPLTALHTDFIVPLCFASIGILFARSIVRQITHTVAMLSVLAKLVAIKKELSNAKSINTRNNNSPS